MNNNNNNNNNNNHQFSLIDSNQREPITIIDSFLNHRWNQIINHQLIINHFELNQEYQLKIKSSSSTTTTTTDSELLIKLTFIASLLSVYVQINYTGPIQFDHQPISILNTHPTHIDNLEEVESELNAISLDALSIAGEPAYHLAKSATFLLMAIQLIDQLIQTTDLNRFPTIIWWKLRAETLRRQLFDQPIPLPDQLLQQIHQLISNLPSNDPYYLDLLSMLTLERGLAEHLTGNEKEANRLFREAVSQAKLEYQLTGIPGKRTKFQEKLISQLVVLAQGRTRPINTTTTTTAVPCLATQDSMPVTLTLDDDTLMEKTQFTQSADSPLKLDPSNQPNLYPLDQALLLALSLSIKNTSPAHGLTNAQMAPFIERVLENPNNWSIHSMALLIRSRLEAHRTRTVERGLLQLQALVDQLSKDAENDPVDRSTPFERVRWTWSLALPSRWELEKELGQKFTGLGLTRSALEIFERLEMWEHVVQCHLNLDSKKLGINLVRELIEGKKIESSLKMSRYRSTRDPKRLGKLWCLLAELEAKPEHWETAWDVSQHTSSRAMRSLGAHHFIQGDYPNAKQCLLRALDINPLFNKTWFIYGCASMRTDDWDEAERAFRRCVALDDEDAEAWNNLATVHLKKASLIDESDTQEGEETDVKLKPLLYDDDGDVLSSTEPERSESGGKFSRPMAAFYALQQAVKLSYDSWRMYTNYMLIAMSVGEYIEATRAFGRVIEIRGEEGVDLEVMEKLIRVVRLQRSDPSETDETTKSKVIGPSRLFERLVDVIDRVVLPKTPTMTVVWELRSELAELDNQHEAALRFQMEAYRLGVSANTERWLSSVDEWLKAIELLKRTILKLIRLGPLITPPTTSSSTSADKSTFANWKWQAKNLVKNFLAKSNSTFDNHPSFDLLKEFSTSLFS